MTKAETIVERVKRLVAEYAGMRLTLRQIFYRLVAAQVIENTKSNYQSLSKILVDARKKRKIPFTAIEDRTRSMHKGHGSDLKALEHFNAYWEYVTNMDKRYTMPKWWGQPKRVQVWLEKQALQALFEQITDAEGVDLAVCKGYPSLTFLWEAARTLRGLTEQIEIVYFGDFDPSGMDIQRFVGQTLREDFGIEVNVTRISITREQIDEYEIPPAPAKESDSRTNAFVAEHGVAWQVELDAIEPRTLQGLIRDSIRVHFDEEAGERRDEELARRREIIRGWLDQAVNPDFEPPEEEA